MQLYPALARRRALALRANLLQRSDYIKSLIAADASSAAVLQDIAAQFAQVRVDLSLNAETYYFAETDDATCLPLAMKYAETLSRSAQASDQVSVAAAGVTLREAVNDLAMLLRHQYLPQSAEGMLAVIESAMADHGCDRHR